jgi:hypothetical protein
VVAKADTSLTLCLCIVHYLGQRYILYNLCGNTSGVYFPNLVEGKLCEVRVARSNTEGCLVYSTGTMRLLIPAQAWDFLS